MAVTPVRRLAALLACVSAVVLLPQPASSVGVRRDLLAGERGSGPPSWHVDTLATASTVHWSDVPNDLWAKSAIDYVAGSHSWMRDFKASNGDDLEFRPDARESRRF